METVPTTPIKKAKTLQERVQEGIEGKYEGLSNGLPGASKYIFGTQRSCYTLLGGESGSYKTTLLDYILDNSLNSAEAQGIEIDIFYYSFEIDKLTKQCNWLSREVFLVYGVVIPSEKIKGFGKNRLNHDEQIMVNALIPAVEAKMDKINFVYDGVNPTGCYKDLIKYFKTQGTILYEEYEYEKDGVMKKSERMTGFIPKDPNKYYLLALDHVALMPLERGFNLKQNIDKLSQYMIILRNIFGLSAFIVQQFNDGLSNVERAKYKGLDISPEKTDFKDTRNTYQDADIVLGTMNPWKMDMDQYGAFKLNTWKDSFIILKIIKNRLSKDNIIKPLLAHPTSGRFEELKPPEKPKPQGFGTK
jgi:hypothetical protein